MDQKCNVIGVAHTDRPTAITNSAVFLPAKRDFKPILSTFFGPKHKHKNHTHKKKKVLFAAAESSCA